MDINSFSPHSGRYINEDNKSVNVVEGITGGFVTTESDHSASHLGYGYKGHLVISNLAAGQSLSWCLTGPATKFIHLKNIVLTALGSSCKLEILKGAVVTTNAGTAIALNNTNHNSDNVSQSTLKPNPVYTDGVMWDQIFAFADSTNQVVATASFQASPYEELVTKAANEKYIIKLTNIGGDNVSNAWMKVFFYEEPKGIIERG